jgi:hypothetical protein
MAAPSPGSESCTDPEAAHMAQVLLDTHRHLRVTSTRCNVTVTP